MADLSQFTSHCPPFTPRKAKGPSLFTMLKLWHQRRALAQLDAHQLCDIGISYQAAQHEATRPVWDVPCGWRA